MDRDTGGTPWVPATRKEKDVRSVSLLSALKNLAARSIFDTSWSVTNNPRALVRKSCSLRWYFSPHHALDPASGACHISWCIYFMLGTFTRSSSAHLCFCFRKWHTTQRTPVTAAGDERTRNQGDGQIRVNGS